MSKNLVIVESPAKAKTIEKYLGADFKVLSSVGHIRKDTKVDKSTFDVTYEIDPDHQKIVSELKKAVKAADTVWLATDEDREGEAISWHLREVLNLPEDTHRITFHEITKPALEAAIKNPRQIDMNMVASQQARQTLDMLVGFDLSGIVRKKVPGAISAGRVQSPALRLIVEREQAIAKFAQKSTFKVSGSFGNPEFSANLADKNQPETEADAKNLLEKLKNAIFKVADVEQTAGSKSNPTPLTTAALQIEANAKLGFATSTTMRAAQSLYQAGLITYHRTDSLNLSNQALTAMATYITEHFGKEYLHTRHFKTKDASAQEAHEAIRPTHIEQAEAGKNDFERKLYHLIWSRTLATQMSDAKVAKTKITLQPSDAKSPESLSFSALGEVVVFDGFLKVYGSAKDTTLPSLKTGEIVPCHELVARQTFAKAPARYTEGSLVKKLEELGIGRPSTYAPIMSAIQSRGYVTKGESDGDEREIIELRLSLTDAFSGTLKAARPSLRPENASVNDSPSISRTLVTEKFGANKGKLIPSPIGELITNFLLDNFKNTVDYKFTAHIEKDLDLIADAKLDRVQMLRDFYRNFEPDVLAAEGIERYNNARLLGHDPETGKPIFAKIGKNGGFIQLGDNEKTTGEKPRFAPLPKRKSTKTVTLEQALAQLALPTLPRSLGNAADGTELIAANGPFGPYLKAGKYNIPLGKLDPYTVTLAETEPLYRAKVDSILADFGDIMIINGAYGPYVKGPGRRNNVKVPKDQDPKALTKEQAEELLKNKPKTTRRAPRRAKKS